MWAALFRHQTAQAVLAERATDQMLAEQDLDVAAEALLNSAAFTTALARFEQMLEQVTADQQAQRLAESLTQDAARTAQQVAVAVRPHVSHVRLLTPPSCSRCAVLAGRAYRYSEGFKRHPGCDCVMIPVTVASPDFTHDIDALIRDGQVTGLSKADRRALAEGADFAKVVNIRSRKAGLTQSGRVLDRAGRSTPEGIFQTASDREEALALLKRHGYLL